MATHTHPAQEAIDRIRAGEDSVGYWIVLDSPASTERLALLGYDYLTVDAQHGLLGYSGILNSLLAIDAAHGPAGLVRVRANDPAEIGQALDAGARGVIVPLVDDATGAAAAVAAARYTGRRSYGPMRAELRIGPAPAEADRRTLVLAMIETASGLDNVEQICAVDGLDGVYVGPSDLALALGAPTPAEPVQPDFDRALERIRRAAQDAGKIAGIHTADAIVARQRRSLGYTMITIASDLSHLEQAAADHLRDLGSS